MRDVRRASGAQPERGQLPQCTTPLFSLQGAMSPPHILHTSLPSSNSFPQTRLPQTHLPGSSHEPARHADTPTPPSRNRARASSLAHSAFIASALPISPPIDCTPRQTLCRIRRGCGPCDPAPHTRDAGNAVGMLGRAGGVGRRVEGGSEGCGALSLVCRVPECARRVGRTRRDTGRRRLAEDDQGAPLRGTGEYRRLSSLLNDLSQLHALVADSGTRRTALVTAT